MKKNKVALLIIAFALLFSGIAMLGYFTWHAFFPQKSFDLRVVPLKARGRTFKAEVADTTLSRSRGLSGRDSIDKDEVMLFLFPFAGKHGFWMKDVHFGIDIVWLKNKNVVHIEANVPAPVSGEVSFSLPVYYPASAADAVIEFASGTVKDIGMVKGDRVEYESPQKTPDGAL